MRRFTTGLKKTIPTMLLLLTLLTLVPAAVKADYTITMDNDQFNVTWTINAFQNITAFQDVLTGTTIYPSNLTATLTGQDLTALTTALQNAIHGTVSTASITQLTAQITSNSPQYSCAATATCRLQWLNTTLTFTVHETPQTSASSTSYDLSWKAIRLNDDLQTSGVSYNRLGEKYLLQGLQPFVNFQIGVGRTMVVRIQDIPVNSGTYQTPTQNIVLYDMSSLQTPIEKWNYTRDIFTGKQTWTSPNNGGFKVQAVFAITEAGTVFREAYFATAIVSAHITTPLNVAAKGDKLVTDTSGGLLEKIELGTILGSLGVLLGSIIIEHRITGTSSRTKRAKKR